MKLMPLCMLALSLAVAAQAEVKHIRTSDGVDLYVTVQGKGTPCLYIHGGPGSGSFWVQKFVGDILEKRFQMVYLDQRGGCHSTSPRDSNYSMERMVKDFEEIRTALGIKQWLTMGHSFGGLLQMGYAQRCPEVISGMIMINCTLNWKESYDRAFCPRACEYLGTNDSEPYTDERVPFIDRFGSLIQKLNEKDLMWKMGYASRKNLEIMGATFVEIPKWNWDGERFIVYTRDYWVDFKKSTPAMSMPVLFFYGTNDWSIGPKHFQGVEFPRMMLFGSAVGHMPFLEAKDDLEKALAASHRFRSERVGLRDGALPRATRRR